MSYIANEPYNLSYRQFRLQTLLKEMKDEMEDIFITEMKTKLMILF